MKLFNQSIFIGILLCLPLFSVAAPPIVEDVIIYSYSDSSDNAPDTMTTFGEIVSEDYVYQQQLDNKIVYPHPSSDNNSIYTMETFEPITVEDYIYQQQSNNMDAPHAPFPWPCDSIEDCAQTMYYETIRNRDTSSFGRSNNMDAPHAPFPWPCDSIEDCAQMYDENMESLPEMHIMNTSTPHAPFPWPCDVTGDCASQLQIRRVDLFPF